MAATLVIYRGLPGSGKSTTAKEWVSNNPGRRARVNRDSLRAMMHDGYRTKVTEEQVTAAQYAMIEALLSRGTSVACDDTNLRDDVVETMRDIASRSGAEVEIVDRRNVPLELCLLGNSSPDRVAAGTVVPEDTIRQMYRDYILNKGD